MSSDSELDEFYDAEDSTPIKPGKLEPVEERKNSLDDIEKEELVLLELERQLEERRKKEDEALQQRLQALVQKKQAEKEKKQEDEKKDQLERKRRKHEELRRKMARRHCDSLEDYISDDESDTADATDGPGRRVGSVEPTPNPASDSDSELAINNSNNNATGNNLSEVSVNINSAQPEKEKHNKQFYDIVADKGSKMDTMDHNNLIDVDNIVDNVLQESHLLDDENEPDIVKSTKTRTPPNTLTTNTVPVSRTSVEDDSQLMRPPSEPIAPPRRKKKPKIMLTEDCDSDLPDSQRSSVSSLASDSSRPQSPGLPPEKLLTPPGAGGLHMGLQPRALTEEDLEHQLDLRSIIRGRKHIKAEDADISAVNSDHDSPRQTLEASGGTSFSSHSGRLSKTSSLDSKRTSSLDSKESKRTSKSTSLESHKSKSSSLEKEERRRSRHNSGQQEAASRKDSLKKQRSMSGRLLTDEEILLSVMVKNLDTGEAVPLKDADAKIQKCMDPLVLHIMERTKDYPSDDNSYQDDDDRTSVSGRSMLAEKTLKKKGAKLKKLFGKKVGQTVTKMKSVADQVMHNEENTTVAAEEGLSEDARRLKFKANHNKKGPWEFGQLQQIQDLNGEHTGAVWVMKFSPCGRLLATGGQDSVLRIWVLESAFSYFDDMRQKYVEMKVSPAPSQESLNSIPSTTSDLSARDLGAAAEKDEETSSGGGPFKNKPFCKYRGHTADLLDISWSKNYFILSSSMDKTVRLWHISRRECLCTFQHIDFVTAIVFHPKDDRYFLSGSLDGKLRLWNIPDKKVSLWNEAGNGVLITTANFCHNGKFAVVGTYDGKCIFYSTEHLKYYTQIHVRSTRGRNSRGRKITGIEPLPGEDKVLVTSNDSRVRLYDLRDLTLTCKYKGPTNTSSQIRASFSPQGRYVICGSEDHFVYVWKTQHEFFKFSSARRDRNDYYEAAKLHNAVVTSAVFAPNPSYFLNTDDASCHTSKSTKEVDTASTAAECELEFIISADFSGAIKVTRAK